MFDANDPDSFHAAETFGADILKLCVEVGGCLTGEHGVGVEKRDLMGVQFTETELEQQRAHQVRVRPGLAAQPGQGVPAARPPPRCRSRRMSGRRWRRPSEAGIAAGRSLAARARAREPLLVSRAAAPSAACCARCRRPARSPRAT